MLPRKSVIAATAMACLAATLLPVGPAAATPPGRAMYVTNSATNDISTFTLGADGRPSRLGDLLDSGAGPGGIVLAPDGRTAYVANRGAGTVTAYAVDRRGELVRPGTAVETRGQLPFGIAMHPGGGFMYVSNIDSGTISVFQIRGEGTPRLLGTPISSGAESTRGLGVTPDGRFLYAGHGRPMGNPTDVITAFAIQGDGSLRAVGRPVTVGGAGTGNAFSPDGRFFYMATMNTEQVYGFRVGLDGSLTPVPRSPFAAQAKVEGVAMAPGGSHLFAASPGQVGPDGRAVMAYSIGPDGSLTPVPGSPFKAGTSPVGIATTPDGRRLYVSNADSHDVTSFEIGPGGALREIEESRIPTGGRNPVFQALAIRPNQGPVAAFSAAVYPAGRPTVFNASASADGDGRVARYDWDFGDGTVLRDGGPSPAHVYRSPGPYLVTLTVTDDEGCAAVRVFTGQLAHCNGSAAARTARRITIS